MTSPQGPSNGNGDHAGNGNGNRPGDGGAPVPTGSNGAANGSANGNAIELAAILG